MTRKELPPDIYVFTNKDKAFEETQLEGSYDYDKENYDKMVTQVFTDRAIYRPGQTVHASVIAYQNTKQDYRLRLQADKPSILV